MTQDPIAILRDKLNRTAKIDADNGSAPDFDTAVERLRTHRIAILAGPEVVASAAHQAALLTVVNIARRFALGGVVVSGPLSGPLLVLEPNKRSLGEEVIKLGALEGAMPDCVPTIVVGTPDQARSGGVAATFAGWRGGIVPEDAVRLDEQTSVIPAAVLAGALAASEAFAMLRGEVEAGHRSLGLSLWRPNRSFDWKHSSSDGPVLTSLPDHLWVLGLGHIGQAFLWTLMCCPYAERKKVRLVLHDTDVVTGSTDSTSILTQPPMIGAMKTRSVARVLEEAGFTTALVERPFDGRFERRDADDPAVLICGVDNALARSQLELPGFPFVVEGGIGNQTTDFRAMRVHTFPGERKACDLWKPGTRETANVPAGSEIAEVPELPGYRRLREAGGDDCGLALLAQTAVGAPFVGTVTGTLMLAQILRLLAGDAPDAVVNLDLKAMHSRRAVPNRRLQQFNPGFQPAV
jgi:hypothetical protein